MYKGLSMIVRFLNLEISPSFAYLCFPHVGLLVRYNMYKRWLTTVSPIFVVLYEWALADFHQVRASDVRPGAVPNSIE